MNLFLEKFLSFGFVETESEMNISNNFFDIFLLILGLLRWEVRKTSFSQIVLNLVSFRFVDMKKKIFFLLQKLSLISLVFDLLRWEVKRTLGIYF